jgi:hypothetical protein
MPRTSFRSAGLATVVAAACGLQASARAAGEEKAPLVFTGGHETDPRDRGRPVALVAGALGVPPEVFREAFRKVRPAPAGKEPEPEQVRRNKQVLMEALGPHGVTNERLDEVSNYYRYVPGRGKLWPVKAAAGYAVIKDGKVTAVVIAEPGSGYNALPKVTVAGHPELSIKAALVFDRDLKKNGSIAALNPEPAAGKTD